MNRTLLQNKSLHKYCELLAEALNDAGYDFKEVITMPVSFTKENVKEYMFRRVMSALYPDLESTTELTTVQIQTVYNELDRLTATKFGIHVEWPSEESMMYEKQEST